jgi:hypothetical protein
MERHTHTAHTVYSSYPWGYLKLVHMFSRLPCAASAGQLNHQGPR